ncbi:MAG: uracil-DNA glycosylase [Pseudomonadota bacterium]
MPESKDRLVMEASWKARLHGEFSQPYMLGLREFLLQRKRKGAHIYPAGSNYFRAMELTPFEQVKVVVLGQDPYHGPGQAHGLCFSVMPGIPTPPSLVNIYKEIHNDVGIAPAQHGFLEPWAKQGVFLLNSVLTVERGNAGAHQGKGWEQFTDKIVEILSDTSDGVVFLLWGSYAQRKGQMIDRDKHLVLTAPHPSPLSAHRGFFGCRHFSRANEWLTGRGKKPIEWELPPLNQ